MPDPRLVVFDVDGTLIDSAASILEAMRRAFEGAGTVPPPDAAVHAIVGLSLPEAMRALAPQADDATLGRLCDGYRAAFRAVRAEGGAEAASPLHPGARAALTALNARPEVLLGLATGKSRRGVEHLLDAHDLRGLMVTTQCADDHPSKPHPAMLQAALAETGVDARRAAIVGDTDFDVAMGRAAGVLTVGVAWGHHPPERLRAAGADVVIARFADLVPALDRLWEVAAA